MERWVDTRDTRGSKQTSCRPCCYVRFTFSVLGMYCLDSALFNHWKLSCTVQPLKTIMIKAWAHSDKIVSRHAQPHIHGIDGQRWRQACTERNVFFFFIFPSSFPGHSYRNGLSGWKLTTIDLLGRYPVSEYADAYERILEGDEKLL